MLYCDECQTKETPATDCVSCRRERRRQVFSLARSIFARTVSRRHEPGGAEVTFADHAVEAFIASDDFLRIADEWLTSGRDGVTSKHPRRDADPPRD